MAKKPPAQQHYVKRKQIPTSKKQNIRMSNDEMSSCWNRHPASVNRRFVCSPLLVNAHDFLYKGTARGPVQLLWGAKRTKMRSRLWSLLCSNYVVTLCSSWRKDWASGSAHFITCVAAVYSSCSLVKQDGRAIICAMGRGSHFLWGLIHNIMLFLFILTIC